MFGLDGIATAHLAIALIASVGAAMAGFAALLGLRNRNSITEVDVKVNGRIDELVELRAQEIAAERAAEPKP